MARAGAVVSGKSHNQRPWPGRRWPWMTCSDHLALEVSARATTLRKPSLSAPALSTAGTWARGEVGEHTQTPELSSHWLGAALDQQSPLHAPRNGPHVPGGRCRPHPSFCGMVLPASLASGCKAIPPLTATRPTSAPLKGSGSAGERYGGFRQEAAQGWGKGGPELELSGGV